MTTAIFEVRLVSRWFTAWPSTHVNAGRTVEVMPVSEYDRLREAASVRQSLSSHAYCDAWLRATRRGSVDDGRDLVNALTPIVNRADERHQTEGGGTRHWVRDYFLPELRAAGWTIHEEGE